MMLHYQPEPEGSKHDAMVANILAVYDRATEEQLASGRQWYATAGDLVAVIADRTGMPADRVAFAVSALSPRNPWRWNIADAYAFASARAEGRTMPRATTFKRNQLNAWQALAPDGTGLSPWVTSAPKVRAFVQAIMGDSEAVVVDIWARRVATGEAKPSSTISDKTYAAIAHAYNVAANLRGEAPANMQAITWTVARTEGTASGLNPNASTFKSGTPDWLKEAIS